MRDLMRLNGKIIGIAAIILLISSLGCQRDNTASIAAIDQAREEIDAAWLAEDIDVILSHAADNIIFMPPNMGKIKGKDNIRNFLQGFFDQFNMTDLKALDRNVHIIKDWAIEEGVTEWVIVPEGGSEGAKDQINFICLWYQQPDRSWKETRMIWNSALPVPETQ